MLYNPPAFKVEDRETLHTHIRQAGIATLVTNGSEGPLVSHVPLIFDAEKGEHGTLLGHMAKANPHWQSGDMSLDALAIFHGPDAYISPSWYPSKQEHGRVVPTWNYAVVHAEGVPKVIDDAAWLLHHVSELTDTHEKEYSIPWQVADAPADYIEKLCSAIVGIEIPIAKLTGKWKLGQNRSEADKLGMVGGLTESETTQAQGLANLISQHIKTCAE